METEKKNKEKKVAFFKSKLEVFLRSRLLKRNSGSRFGEEVSEEENWRGRRRGREKSISRCRGA